MVAVQSTGNEVVVKPLKTIQYENISEDEVWDVWQIEGPAMVWYIRGKPHVHTWVLIRDKV